jgi:hypothetical protein
MPDRDYSEAALRSAPKGLAALLNSGSLAARLWRPEELASIFRHQLTAPVLVDLGRLDLGAAAKVRGLTDAQGLLLKSFSELFHHPTPPIELLTLTKDFAKANMNHPESALPSEVATAIYYLSIAAAAVRLGERISQLKDADLRRGYAWVCAQDWIDPQTKDLLVTAMDRLPAPTSGGAEART